VGRRHSTPPITRDTDSVGGGDQTATQPKGAPHGGATVPPRGPNRRSHRNIRTRGLGPNPNTTTRPSLHYQPPSRPSRRSQSLAALTTPRITKETSITNPHPIYNDLMHQHDPDMHRFCDHTPYGWVQYDPYPKRCTDQNS